MIAAIEMIALIAPGCSTCASEPATAVPPALAPASLPAPEPRAGAAPAPATAAAAPIAPVDPRTVLPGRWIGRTTGQAIVITPTATGADVRWCDDPSEHEPCVEGTAPTLGPRFRAALSGDEEEGAGDAPPEPEIELDLALDASGETLHVRSVRQPDGFRAIDEDYRPSDWLEWSHDSDAADAAHQEFEIRVADGEAAGESGGEDEGGEDEGAEQEVEDPAPLGLVDTVVENGAFLLRVEHAALARLGRNPRALDQDAALRIDQLAYDVLARGLRCGDVDRGLGRCAHLVPAAIDALARAIGTGSEPRSLIGAVPATITVSSALASRPATLMLDGDLDTAWSSEHGDLVGASIAIELPADARVTDILLTPGYAREALFEQNHRIARVRVVHAGDPPRAIDLPTARGDLVPLGVTGGGGLWTIEILATVPGTRADWTELCVSELRVIGVAPGDRAAIVPPTIRVARRE